MKVFLLLLAIIPMFSNVKGGSESMSCSTVNGKMVCERQKSDGNVAFSAAGARTGYGQDDYMGALAGTGYSGTGDYSASQTSSGNPGYNFGGFSSGSSADYYSYSQPSSGGFPGAAAGAGAFPFFYGPGFAYPPQAPAAPPPETAPPPQGNGPYNPQGNGPYNPQGSDPYNPQGFNPFSFVNGFMGGGFGFGPYGPGAAAGAFAGGFGRR